VRLIDRTHRAAEDGQSRGVEPRVFSNWFPSLFFCNLKRLGCDPIPTAAKPGQADLPSDSNTPSTISGKVVFHSRRQRGGRGELWCSSRDQIAFKSPLIALEATEADVLRLSRKWFPVCERA
jgi:hypothetical protein